MYYLHHLVAGLLMVFMTRAANVPPQCPSQDEIKNLAKSISGVLLTKNDTGYDKAAEMKNTLFNSRFSFIMYPALIDDIVKYVKFIRQFGLRPSVSSSGHDYIGRSSGDQTYHLGMEKYKEISINTTDTESSTGASMTATTGNSWLDLYRAADKQNMIVLGGSAHSVALGGYMQGGGHSPLSPKLGLGVDQIIRLTMVTVNGDIIEADKNGYKLTTNGTTTQVNDPEVFRAVLGGGGGTFGFVHSFKMKLHPPPVDGFVQLQAHYALTLTNMAFSFGDQVIRKYSEMIRKMNENWGGFFLVRSGSILPDVYRGTVSLFLLHWGSYADAKPIIDEIEAFHPEWNPTIVVKNYSTFLKYEETIKDPTGFRTLVANRFLHDADFQSDYKFFRTINQTLNYEIDIDCTGVLIGHATKIASPHTSVSKNFKEGRMAYTCGVGWLEADHDEYFYKQFDKYVNNELYTIGEGTYYNEPHPDLPNWKVAYWGSMENYNRLLAVKKKLDPDNVLWCHHCVGSDAADYDTPCPNKANMLSVMVHVPLLVLMLYYCW